MKISIFDSLNVMHDWRAERGVSFHWWLIACGVALFLGMIL